MRFGICGSLEIADRAREAGFDYLEVGASAFATRDDFDPEVYRAAGAETSNLFFPGTIHLQGPQATPFREYAETAVSRAAQIGLSVMVIGSGGSRKAPEGVGLEEANRRFVEVVAEIQSLARAKGILIAPESLNRSETNVGNDLASLARMLREAGVGYTADSYHLLYEWKANGGQDEPRWVDEIPFIPSHVHVSGHDRKMPSPDDRLMQGFFHRLWELGYDGRVSLEANLPDLSVQTLRLACDSLRALGQV